MRTLTTFRCGDDLLGGTYDHGDRTTGMLMVTGGTELRSGAHYGMARLAAAVAERGFPVFRFDRRGVGDSEGVDPGFADSGPDIAAAVAAVKTLRPDLRHLVGFGLCDGATALACHQHAIGFDAIALANLWVVESEAGAPPPAAIAHRYRTQLLSLAGWRRILTGGIDYRKAFRGLCRLCAGSDDRLASRFATAIGRVDRRVAIILAATDATALAFEREWRGSLFARARATPTITVVSVDSSSHSFANGDDPRHLAMFCVDVLEECDRA
jgi:exosortase A-associated hydrolase 1